MTDRNFQKKKRNDIKRKKKPVMLIVAEGRNKTEKQYFGSFQNQHGKYVIRFATGLETDPVGMLKAVEKAWSKNELSTKDGDKAYIVLDMDCKPDKIRLVKELQWGHIFATPETAWMTSNGQFRKSASYSWWTRMDMKGQIWSYSLTHSRR